MELLSEAFTALDMEPALQIILVPDNGGKDKNFAEYKAADLRAKCEMCVEDRDKKKKPRTKVLSKSFMKDCEMMQSG